MSYRLADTHKTAYAYTMNFERRGFTLIELMIVMVIMVILLGLGVAAMGNLQAQARDSERRRDAEAIARGLEQFYNQGNPVSITRYSTTFNGKFAYPDPTMMKFMMGCQLPVAYSPNKIPSNLLTSLPGTTPQSLTAPGKEKDALWKQFNSTCDGTVPNSIYILEADTQYDEYDLDNPDNDPVLKNIITTDRYVYASLYYTPLWGSWICDNGGTGCDRFYLYYRTETDNAIHIIKSKHQQ